jgi:hypothetical protein
MNPLERAVFILSAGATADEKVGLSEGERDGVEEIFTRKLSVTDFAHLHRHKHLHNLNFLFHKDDIIVPEQSGL